MQAIILAVLVAMFGLTTVGAAHAKHVVRTIEPVSGSGVPGCENTAAGCYAPRAMTIDAGSTITFENTDTVVHTFTSGTPGITPDGHFDSGLVTSGNSWEWTAKQGSYAYHCILHPWRTGELVVLAAQAPEPAVNSEEQQIPSWVKNNALWWAEGKISDAEYATALTYLVVEGIITIPKPAPTCDEIRYSYLLNTIAYNSINDILFYSPFQETVMIQAKEASDKFVESGCSRPTGADAKIWDTVIKLASKPTESNSCQLFCDSTGYEPSWAKNMGEMQAGSKCMNLIGTERGTKDRNWCSEFSGYLLDQIR